MPDSLLRRFGPVRSGEIHNTVPFQAFRPTANDHDGISVSLKSLSSIKIVLSTGPAIQSTYHVAEFPNSLLAKLNLTLHHKPTLLDPGHSVIPEINSTYRDKANKTGKARMVELMNQLSEASIVVHRPP